MALQNLATLENGYGVSIRRLSDFAEDTYPGLRDTSRQALLKAVSVILFKLEGQHIRRHPEYEMDDRLLLAQPDDTAGGTVEIEGKKLPFAGHGVFPTLHRADPYALTARKSDVLDGLERAFQGSERLQRHIRFLYESGSMYRIYNQNLLFHGCIPLDEDGELATVVALPAGRYAERNIWITATTRRGRVFQPGLGCARRL